MHYFPLFIESKDHMGCGHRHLSHGNYSPGMPISYSQQNLILDLFKIIKKKTVQNITGRLQHS